MGTLERFREQVQDCIRKHSKEAAVFWADKCVSLSRGAIEDVFWLSQAFFHNGEFHRASYLLTSRRFAETNLCCRYLAARCHIECNEWDEAMAILGEDKTREQGHGQDEFVPLEHVRSCLALLRGRVYEALDNRPLAVESFKLALQRNVWCYEAMERLTTHHMLNGKDEIAFLNQLQFENDCKDDEAVYVRYLYKTKLKKYDGIPFEEAEHPDTLIDNAEVVISEAERLYYQCDFRRCHEITTRVLDADPYHHACLPIHLACLVELKDKNSLFYIAHKLVDSYPEKAVAWFAVGCYYHLIGNNETARRFFGKATNADVHFGPAWIGFGHAFAAEGEHDQAMAAYCAAARLMSGCHLPLLYIGMEHSQTNSPKMAMQYFQQAYDICSSDPLVLHQLGVTYFRNSQYGDAKTYFLRALERSTPEDESMLCPANWEPTVCNLAQTHHKLGEYEEAITRYEQALALAPNIGSTYAGLGYAHHCMKNYDEAIQCYHQALSLEPTNLFSTHMLKIVLEEDMLSTDIEESTAAGDYSIADNSAMSELNQTAHIDFGDSFDQDMSMSSV